MDRRLLNDEQRCYFKSIVKGHTTCEIIDMFYDKFKMKLTPQQVKHQKRKLHLQSGVNTKFKKGQEAHNHKEIGYESKTLEGYTRIKIAEPDVFEYKHRYLYEKYIGHIPENHRVIFLDGNKENFDLDNLKLVSLDELTFMSGVQLFSKNKDLTELGILTAKLMVKARKVGKNG